MNLGLYRTVAAMRTNQQRVEVIASNIANVETTGFKRLLHVAHGAASWARNRPYEQVVAGTRVDFQQGVLQRTGEPLDLAIEGRGFFVLDGAQGETYTRDGTFHATRDGVLVSNDGRPVVWEGRRGVIDVAGPDVKVDGTGQVLQGGEIVGRIRTVDFPDPDDVELDAQGEFRAREGATVVPAGDAIVHQGFVERANVQTVDELVELIAAQRSFDTAAQTFRLIDQSYQRLHRR